MNTAEVWAQYRELQEDLFYADTREERLHYAEEMEENYRLVPDDAPFECETPTLG